MSDESATLAASALTSGSPGASCEALATESWASPKSASVKSVWARRNHFSASAERPLSGEAAPEHPARSAEAASARQQTLRFSVTETNPDRTKTYYLVVRDTEDNLELVRESWSISLAITDDFGDF